MPLKQRNQTKPSLIKDHDMEHSERMKPKQ